MLGALLTDGSMSYLQDSIKDNAAYFRSISMISNNNVEIRQITTGVPFFSLTSTDRWAVITQYASSHVWGTGPTWRCPAGSALFGTAEKEFNHLWTNASSVENTTSS